LAALTATGIIFAVLGVIPWAWILVGAFLAGLLDAPLLIGTFAARSQYSPRHLHATVFTIAASAKLGAMSLGAALGGLLLSDRATSAGFVAIGIMHIVAVAMSIAALRRTKTGSGNIRAESSGRAVQANEARRSISTPRSKPL